MRKISIGVMLLLLAFTIFSCAKEEEFKVVQGEPLVYLSVKDAQASSFDNTPDWAPVPNPMAPVDRNTLTRWSPKLGFDNEWIYFDFGEPKVMSKIIIHWEAAFATEYEILTSMDAKKWSRLVLKKGASGGIEEIEFPAVKSKFVKIIGLKRNNPEWGFSMWEFAMYGPKSLNPEEKDVRREEDNQTKKKELETELAGLKTELVPFSLEEFNKGVVYTSWAAGEMDSIASDLTLVHLGKIGVKHLAIMIPTYQDEVDSDEIYTNDRPGGDTPTDEAIIHAIKTCHTLGIKVMLKPHVDCRDGTFRGDIIASDKWFESYKKMILRYAKLAAENSVELFSIGTELENTTFSRWENQWLDVINAVREVYKGALIYSANWSEYEGVPFWHLMDLIGIDAYFPLTANNEPTKEELINAWNGTADRIEKWLADNNYNKGIIFTELGYVSSDGTASQPWATLSNKEDQEEQASALDAALTVLTRRSWFRGMYLWQYFPQERWSPLGYPIKGKLAEEVLKKWYNNL